MRPRLTRRAAAESAASDALVALHRVDLGRLRQGKCEGAAAGIEIGDTLCAACRGDDKVRHRLLRLGAGLQERAGRQIDGDAAEQNLWRAVLDDRLRLVLAGLPGKTRQPLRPGEIRQRDAAIPAGLMIGADQEIDARGGRRGRDLGLCASPQFAAQHRPQRHDQGRQGGLHHMAFPEIDNVVAFMGMETQDGAALPRPRRQGNAPPAAGRCPDQRRHGRLGQALLPQRFHHPPALPLGIEPVIHMLERAAAAAAEMGAGRLPPRRPRLLHRQDFRRQPLAPGFAQPDSQPVAWYAIGHIDRPALDHGDSIALAAQPVDGDHAFVAGRGAAGRRSHNLS